MKRSSILTVTSAAAAVPVGIVLAAVLTWLLTHRERYWQAGAGVFLLAVIGGVIARDVYRRKFDPSNIKYFALCSYAVFLGIGMLLDLRDEAYSFDGVGILFSLAALFCFLLGLMQRHQPSTQFCPESREWINLDQLFKLAILFHLIGFGALFAEWHFFGQLQSYSGRLVSDTGIVDPLPAPLYVWTQFLGPASIMTLVLLRRGCSWRKTVVLWILLFSTVAWYALEGVRSNFLALAIAWLLVWLEVPDKRGSKRIGSLPIIVSCVASAAMLALSVVRTDWNFSRAREEWLFGVEKGIGESLNIFREFCKTIEFFPAHTHYLYGYSFYGIAANIVPRVWWPDKPMGIGKLTSILFDQNPNNSIALSLPGELYANFGPLGALLGMVLFGVALKTVYHWYRRRRGDHAALVIYVFVVVTATQEIRGDILDATMPLFYHLLPVVLAFCAVAALTKLRTRNSQAGGGFVTPRPAVD